jgi:hypothetical protein
MSRLALSAAFILIATGFAEAQPGTDPRIAADEQILKSANLPTDNANLLNYLRQQTLKADERERIAESVHRLDSKAYLSRQKATADILTIGPKALPVLRQAVVQGATLEMRMRLERCIKELEQKSPALTAGAAVRLLRHRRPDGVCTVLMDYLTSAPDELVEEEVIAALSALAGVGGRPDPVFEQALSDEIPVRRAAAALVLGRAGTRQQRLLVHLLLDDVQPTVRLRAAQGLLLGRDRDAVPALIGLVGKSPMNVAEQAEELLILLAGKSAPAVLLTDEAGNRQKCFMAWRNWWQAQQGKFELSRADLSAISHQNTDDRAREVARLFVAALFKNDLPLLRRVTDVPFVIQGIERIETREAWETLVAQMGIVPDGRNEFRFEPKKIVSIEEYQKQASIPEERQFLEGLRKQPIRVVLGDLYQGNQRQQPFALCVRITGARVRVIAFGIPQEISLK